MNKNAQELAQDIRNNPEWDLDQLKEFCILAGLEKEWEEADGDTFESVAYKAADILNVEIV